MTNFIRELDHKEEDYKANLFLKKLLKDLNLFYLDFSLKKRYSISINTINFTFNLVKKVIPLKKGIKITIEKQGNESYLICQRDFNIYIKEKTLNKALKNFQNHFYILYQRIMTKKHLNPKEKKLKKLFREIF